MRSEEELPGDPLELFDQWYRIGEQSEPVNPNAMCLATADADGRPSARMVLLKGYDSHGFVFYTNSESDKGRQLAANPIAALCFYWRGVGLQIRVEGRVGIVPGDEAGAYFASRARGSRIGAWASAQSRPLTSRDDLVRRVAELEEMYVGGAVPRPPYWNGYRLVADRYEFWRDRPDRLHDRHLYTRDEEGDGWTITLLNP